MFFFFTNKLCRCSGRKKIVSGLVGREMNPINVYSSIQYIVKSLQCGLLFKFRLFGYTFRKAALLLQNSSMIKQNSAKKHSGRGICCPVVYSFVKCLIFSGHCQENKNTCSS